FYILFFFFLAEDGIRDFHVTGVQTCALPIFDVVRHFHQNPPAAAALSRSRDHWSCSLTQASVPNFGGSFFGAAFFAPNWLCRPSSEERRVGKLYSLYRYADPASKTAQFKS